MAGLTAQAFVSLYMACAPVGSPGADSLAGIAMKESQMNPLAIRDEATGEGIMPTSLAEAKRIAAERIALGHRLGLGLFQITGQSNWDKHRLNLNNAFDPCANLRAGANHYRENLEHAARQLYNSGRSNGAPAYAASVADLVAQARGRTPLLASLQPRPPSPRRSRSATPTTTTALASTAPGCARVPPSWDAFGSARYAARCRGGSATRLASR